MVPASHVENSPHVWLRPKRPIAAAVAAALASLSLLFVFAIACGYTPS
jgi:hypothetical protein